MQSFQSKCALFQFLIGILPLSSFARDAYAFDAVTCGTEQATFRQLCKIDGTDHSQAFEISARSEFRGYKFDITGILKKPKLAFEDADETTDIDLLGLQPILEFDTDFTNLDACRQSTLWKDRIAAYLKLSDGTEELASDVIVGAKHHTIDLASSSESKQARYVISTSTNGSQVSFETKIFFKNLDDFPGRSVSLKRIPPSCQLKVFNQKVGFDPLDINANLQTLKVYTATLDQTILKASVLNGLYLKQNTGAVCAVEKLSTTLYSVEGLIATDEPDLLSLPSQGAIADAVSYAVSLGAIPENAIPKDKGNAPDYFEYYKNKENRSALKSNCEAILDTLTVDKKRFLAADGVTPTNNAAYKNALDYERGIRNLKSVIDAAWALVSVAKKDVENSKELEWLIDPSLYGFIENSDSSK